MGLQNSRCSGFVVATQDSVIGYTWIATWRVPLTALLESRSFHWIAIGILIKLDIISDSNVNSGLRRYCKSAPASTFVSELKCVPRSKTRIVFVYCSTHGQYVNMSVVIGRHSAQQSYGVADYRCDEQVPNS